MKVSKKKVIKVFTTLGRKTAKSWSDEELVAAIQTINKNEFGYMGMTLEDAELDEIKDDLILAVERNEKVELTSASKNVELEEEDTSMEENNSEDVHDEEEEQPPKKSKKKEGKSVKTKTNSKDTKSGKEADKKKEKVSKFEHDEWGARVGSFPAKLHALLSEEPQTAGELKKKIGANSSLEYHLDKLVRLGKLKWKSGEGYYLKPSK